MAYVRGSQSSRAYDRGNVPTSVARLDRGYLPVFSLYDSHAGMFREGIGKVKRLRPRLTSSHATAATGLRPMRIYIYETGS